MKSSVVTYIKALLNIITAATLIVMVFVFLPKLIMFFFPFVLGWIISLLARPIIKFFEEKIKLKRKASSAIVIVLVLAIVIAIVYGICYFLVNQIIGFVSDFPDIWATVEKDFDNLGNAFNGVYVKLPSYVRDTLDTFLQSSDKYFENFTIGTDKLKTLGDFVNKIPDIIMGIIMTLLSSYFFVAEKDYLKNITDKYMPSSVKFHLDLVKKSISKAFGGYFKAQFKIEIWVYVLTVTGLLLIRIDYAILIALGICFMDFLPVFGAGTVMIPWAVIKFIDKDYKTGIALLVIWGIGQIVRQLIQPKIVGDSIGMEPIPTLFLLFIGFAYKGVLGMIIAIPVGIIFRNLLEEGIFDTTIKSFRILVAGFNRFRKLNKNDTDLLESYENEIADAYKERIDKKT